MSSNKKINSANLILPGSQTRLYRGDRLYYIITYSILIFLALLVSYPLIYIVSSSFSSPAAVAAGKVVFFPVDLSLRGYSAVMEYDPVYIGYRNTILYTVTGTILNITMTMFAAFGLSRGTVPGVKIFTFLFTFTMMFSGGLIPTYLLMKDLRFLNTPWVMIVPGAISVYNMIIARTFIKGNIPEELFEAASIDGCSDFVFFFRILLPLSKAILAVLALFYAVAHWNAYFNAMIYLRSRNLFPLQLFLREILVLNQIDVNMIMDPELQEALRGMADLLKYSLIIVSTAPIMCVYPFIQKYFVKGVMIGSIKG